MGDELKTIKLAAAQVASVFLDCEATVEKACSLIREAGANGADITGFPENFIPGHPTWYGFMSASDEPLEPAGCQNGLPQLECSRTSGKHPAPGATGGVVVDFRRNSQVQAMAQLPERIV